MSQFEYDQEVRVVGAPGFTDFSGKYLARYDAVDSRGDLAVVETLWGDTAQTAIVPMRCVKKYR